MVPLPVLNADNANPLADPDRARIAADLEQLAPGRVRFDRHDRMLYSTDASIYQIEPIGVVVPDSIDNLIRVVNYCGAQRIPVLMRGGGTSLPGQCTNHAVVIDHSALCRRLLAVDVEHRLCHVEPGMIVDDLNRQLESQHTGLFFAPDPATSAQATIGGCIGNNAAGARSLRYGRTCENVAALDILLPTGQRCWLEPGAGRRNPVALQLAQQVATVAQQHADQIRQRFPKTSRRNAGYALDLILAQLDRGLAPADLDLTGLLCGSAGSLAVVLGAKLKLHPIPRSKGLAIVSFLSVEAAIDAVPAIVRTHPAAVELIDDVVLEAARANAECRRYMDLLPRVDGTNPAAVLYVEYQETGPIEDVAARFDSLRQLVPQAPIATYTDRPSLARAWALRKAGEPLLHNLSAHRKPITCVEDNAIPIENLARFVKEFKEIVTHHGTKAAYYAHASVGVLHVRPMLDLHDPADQDRLRAIAVEVADLARDCGGIMSGEHGDGRIRGPLLERYFGPDLMTAFRQIKSIFDPPGILNPGMVIDLGPIESITQNLRVAPARHPIPWPDVETYFDYSDQEGFIGAVEMCNGAGVCRKSTGGVMCPSYRATRDERHSTRGRANALRLAISGQFSYNGPTGQPAWADPGTIETLSLCLSCKACKSECPSNVDVARLKAEYTAQRYKATGQIPLQAKVFGHIRLLNQLGSLAPNLANWAANLPPIRALMNKLLNLAPKRTLPPFARSLYRWFAAHQSSQADCLRPSSPTTNATSLSGRADIPVCHGQRSGGCTRPPDAGRSLPQNSCPHHSDPARPKVVLYADCFTTYNEPHIGQAAILLLESLGYVVELPKVGCCGRSMISMGLLDDAIRTADATLSQLRPYIADDQVKAILVCEPSCLATMKDEWLQLKLKTDKSLRRQLASKAMLVEEFVERFWSTHPIPPTPHNSVSTDVVFHGHCHQKALGSEDSSTAILKRLAGDRLRILPPGCCGMAGSFGYTRDRYDLSMKVGQQSLFTHIQNAPPDSLLVAPGTSCRHQIKDATTRPTLHPIELIAQLFSPR